MHKYFSNEDIEMQIVLLLFLVPVVFILIIGAYRKKKINLNPKMLHVATSVFIHDQDEVYQAIRKGIDSCENWDDMHESYREIMFYKKDFPDQEGQKDTAILLEAYNNKSNRLLSNF